MHEFVIFVTIKVLCVCVIKLIAKLLIKLLFINKNLDIYDLIWVLKENWKKKKEGKQNLFYFWVTIEH